MQAVAPGCECGDTDAGECRRAFEAALAAEFGDPAYFAVHHLTVAAYQAQHPDAFGKTGAVDILHRFLEEGASPGQVRREFAGGSGPPPERDAPVVGALTLASVRFDDPATYRADIERYARSVLAAAARSRRTGGAAG